MNLANRISKLSERITVILIICTLFCLDGCSESSPSRDPIVITDGESLNHGVKLTVSVGDGRPLDKSTAGVMEMMMTCQYLHGVYDMAYLTQRLDAKQPYKLPDERVAPTQVARIVDRYLSSHPEMLDRTPAQLVVLALVDAYPNK